MVDPVEDCGDHGDSAGETAERSPELLLINGH
jgi:hypothetical protein